MHASPAKRPQRAPRPHATKPPTPGCPLSHCPLPCLLQSPPLIYVEASMKWLHEASYGDCRAYICHRWVAELREVDRKVVVGPHLMEWWLVTLTTGGGGGGEGGAMNERCRTLNLTLIDNGRWIHVWLVFNSHGPDIYSYCTLGLGYFLLFCLLHGYVKR